MENYKLTASGNSITRLSDGLSTHCPKRLSMAGQGYFDEGTDHRLLGGIFAKLCSTLSWNSNKQPPSLIFSFFGFKAYLPLWLFGKDGFLMLRGGCHYDINAKAYILGFALKKTKEASLY